MRKKALTLIDKLQLSDMMGSRLANNKLYSCEVNEENFLE